MSAISSKPRPSVLTVLSLSLNAILGIGLFVAVAVAIWQWVKISDLQAQVQKLTFERDSAVHWTPTSPDRSPVPESRVQASRPSNPAVLKPVEPQTAALLTPRSASPDDVYNVLERIYNEMPSNLWPASDETPIVAQAREQWVKANVNYPPNLDGLTFPGSVRNLGSCNISGKMLSVKQDGTQDQIVVTLATTGLAIWGQQKIAVTTLHLDVTTADGATWKVGRTINATVDYLRIELGTGDKVSLDIIGKIIP